MTLGIEPVTQDSDGNLKEQILKLIEKIYCKKYIGSLEVFRNNPGGIITRFGLRCYEKPLYISADLPDDKFLIYMEKELRSRRFDFTKYFLGYKEDPYHCPTDRRCIKCNEG